MSSSVAGKKKFAKGKTMDLNSFISDLTPGPNVDWAEIMEDNVAAPIEVKSELLKVRKQLPSGPIASREPVQIDMSQVPEHPPFQAFVNNIPFTSTQNDLARLFAQMQVDEVYLIPDRARMSGHQGKGIVTFTARDDLIEALRLDEPMLSGRTLRINVHIDTRQQQQQPRQQYEPPQQQYNRSGGDDRYGRQPAQENDAFANFSSSRRRNQQQYDDRRGGQGAPQYQQPQAQGYERDRGGYNSYRDREYGQPQQQYQGGGGGGGYQDRGGGYQRGGGGGYNEPYQQQQQYGNDGYQQQDRRPPQRQYQQAGDYRNGGGEYNRPLPQQDRPSYGGPPGGRQRTDSHVSQASEAAGGGGGGGVPAERPKLNIKPRSKPSTEEDRDAPAPQRNPSIFGGAKPIDNTEKFLALEERERQERERLLSEQNRYPPGEHHAPAPLRIETQRRTSERTVSQSSSTGPAAHPPLRSPKSPVSSDSVRLAPQVPPGRPEPQAAGVWQRGGGPVPYRGGGGRDRDGGAPRGGGGGERYPSREFHRGGGAGAPRGSDRGGYNNERSRGGYNNDRGGYNSERGRGNGGYERGGPPRAGAGGRGGAQQQHQPPRHARARNARAAVRELTDEEFEQQVRGQQQHEQHSPDGDDTQPQQQSPTEASAEPVAVEGPRDAPERQSPHPATAAPAVDDDEPVNFTATNRFAGLSMEDEHE